MSFLGYNTGVISQIKSRSDVISIPRHDTKKGGFLMQLYFTFPAPSTQDPCSKECAHCSKPIKVFPYQLRENNFCSRECNRAWRKAKAMATLTCEHCAKVYQRRKWNLKGKRNFCSKPCQYAWTKASGVLEGENNPNWKPRIALECEHCGKKYERLQCNIRPGRQFCCQECASAWNSLNIRGEAHPLHKKRPKQCEICGKEYLVIPARFEEAKVCSKVCAGRWIAKNMVGEKAAHWHGGHETYYGPDWYGQRRAARKRDNYTCQRCGVTEADLSRSLDVHHKIRFAFFGVKGHKEANNLENLICLCQQCHPTVEREDYERHSQCLERLSPDGLEV